VLELLPAKRNWTGHPALPAGKLKSGRPAGDEWMPIEAGALLREK
jgi:hypothetical protein